MHLEFYPEKKKKLKTTCSNTHITQLFQSRPLKQVYNNTTNITAHTSSNILGATYLEHIKRVPKKSLPDPLRKISPKIRSLLKGGLLDQDKNVSPPDSDETKVAHVWG